MSQAAAEPHRTRREHLRSVTAALHADVDRAVGAAGFFADRETFARYVARFHAFHRAMAGAAALASPTAAPFWRLGERLAWLEADLDALGAVPLALETTAGFRAPRVADAGAALGALYVIVGSSLGARTLRQRTPVPSVYFERLAATTDFRGMLALLESEAVASEQTLVVGAASTFECVLDHLTGSLSR